jgi:O-antigen/teichoic acid export membrane protein
VLGAFLTNVMVAGLTMVSAILLARLLGPEGRGELAAIQALPLILGNFATLGVHEAVIYFGGGDRRNVGSYAASATAFALLAALPLMAIAYLAMPLFLHAQSVTVVNGSRIYLAILLVNAITILSISTARALHDIRLWNRLRLVSTLLWVLVVIAFFVLGRVDPVGIGFAYVAFYLVAAILMALAVRSLWQPPVRVRPALWPKMVRYGLPLAAGGAPQVMNQRVDQLLMAGLLPREELGIYAVAVAWAALALLPANALAGVVFSKVAGIEDVPTKLRYVVRSTFAVVAITAFTALALGLPAPWVIPWVTTAEFGESAPVAAVLLVSLIFAGTTRVLQDGMKGLGVPSLVLYSEVTALACILAATPPLILRLGAIGAAWAVLAGRLASLGVAVVLARKAARRLLREARAD